MIWFIMLNLSCVLHNYYHISDRVSGWARAGQQARPGSSLSAWVPQNVFLTIRLISIFTTSETWPRKFLDKNYSNSGNQIRIDHAADQSFYILDKYQLSFNANDITNGFCWQADAANPDRDKMF